MSDKEAIVDLLNDLQVKGFWSYGTDRNTGKEEGHDMTPEDIADYLLENGVTVQTWIPVDERFPDVDELVIVYDIKEDYMCSAMFRGSDWMFNGGYLVEVDDFSHWMPLPEPPKEERQCD